MTNMTFIFFGQGLLLFLSKSPRTITDSKALIPFLIYEIPHNELKFDIGSP
jgi:hypothetical protein